MFQNLESIMQYRICFLNLLLNFRFDSTNFHFLFFDNSFIFEWEIYIYHNSFIIYRFFFFFFLRFIIGFQSLKYMFCHQQYHLKENILFHIIKTFFSPRYYYFWIFIDIVFIVFKMKLWDAIFWQRILFCYIPIMKI